MQYSINWLKELSETKWTTKELVENLTMRAFEVEEEELNVSDKVIVGKILEIKKHPNADKLQIAKVDIGEKTQKIVCGAPNIKIGQLVPVALLGAKLSNGMKIKEAEIRGIKSCGMLCAMDELGLGKDHSGVFVLNEKAKIGERLQKYLENQERALEIKVLPDRAHDAFSHVGMAREIGILEGKKIDYDFDGLILPDQKSQELEIEVKESDLCPRYIGIHWKGVEVKESPEWLKEKLRDCGMRPINNIVDATNLIMLELGNPIHAFDESQVRSKIMVRKAKKGEKLILLDGEEKILDENDLVIANPDKILALAGIKGGLNSGITEKTKDLVIEIASFNAVNIRKTRTKLGISTDASLRYEKDIDSNLCEKAAVRVMEIIKNIAGGELEGIVDIYPEKREKWIVSLKKKYINDLLGAEVSEDQVEKTLDLLEIKFKKVKGDWICEVPTQRLDLKTSEDLIEEIGRIWGYENVKSQPIQTSLRPSILNPINSLCREIRNILTGIGFSEVYNHSFYGDKEIKILDIEENHFEIANPVSPEEKYFVASLFPNLLKNVAFNLNNFSNFSLFEIGKIYEDKNNKVSEKLCLGGTFVREGKDNKKEIFLELKGILQSFGRRIDIQLDFKKENQEVKIFSQKEEIGSVKIIEKNIQKKLGIKRFLGTIIVFEMNIRKILSSQEKQKTFRGISKFPKASRDISFLVPIESDSTFEEIKKTIDKKGGKNLTEIQLFDIFKKENKISYAIHLDFVSEEKTLENEEVEKKIQDIQKALEEKGFEIRK